MATSTLLVIPGNKSPQTWEEYVISHGGKTTVAGLDGKEYDYLLYYSRKSIYSVSQLKGYKNGQINY